jgi:hypothetical protein
VPGQGARFAKENILESREKAAFQKIAAPSRETNITHQSVKPFGLRISPTEGKKTLLGALRALSEAGGSFFIKYA